MLLKGKNICKSYSRLFLLAMIGIPIGIVIGAMETLFGKVLLQITDVRNEYKMYLIPLLPIAGAFIVYVYTTFGKNTGKGMSLIFQVGHKEEDNIPLRLIPFSMIGTWMTHLFGGSAGREGVAVQTGATLSYWVGRKLSIEYSPSIFLITGMAAGFAGLFQTPIAAIIFAIEVLVAGTISYQALLPAITAAFASSTTSHLLGLEKFSFSLTSNIGWNSSTIIKLIGLGIIFGIVGGMFAWLLKISKGVCSKKIKNPIVRIVVFGCVLSALFLIFYKGRYSGLGTNLIENSFYGGEVYYYDWILKLLLTILTLSVGFQGGEVTPLFSIGASLGAVLAIILQLPIEFVAALGYVSVFGSATNTFLAPIFIGGEVFGYEYTPYFFVVSAIAYMCNRNQSIYSLQKVFIEGDKSII